MVLNKNILRIILYLVIFSLSKEEEKNKFNELINKYLSKLDINNAYLSYNQYISLLHTLSENYSDYLTLSSIGKTYEGNDIPLITMKSPLSDKVQINNKTGMLFDGMHHGREPVSMMMNIYLILHLLSIPEEYLHIFLSSTNIYFIPIINIDTYKYNSEIFFKTANTRKMMARKNRRVIKSKKCRDEDIGVDLNRNYDYDFAKDNEGSSNDPCQEDYRGEKPFSEPETRAIKDFVDSHPNIKIVYNYHTWGNLIITPFNCLKKKDSENLMKTKYPLHYNIYEDFKNEAEFPINFLFGNADKTIKYITNGDATDWFLGKKNILSFSPELGNGKTNSDYFYPNRQISFDVLEKNLVSGLYAIQKSMFYIKGELISASYIPCTNKELRQIYPELKKIDTKKCSYNEIILEVKSKIINKGFGDYTPGIELPILEPEKNGTKNSIKKYYYFLALDLDIDFDIDNVKTICYWSVLDTIFIKELTNNEKEGEETKILGKSSTCVDIKNKNDLEEFKIFFGDEIKSMKYIILNILFIIKKEPFYKMLNIKSSNAKFLSQINTSSTKNDTEIIKIYKKENRRIKSYDANNEIIEWKFNSPKINIKLSDIKPHDLLYSYNKYVMHSKKAMLIILLSLIIIIIILCIAMKKMNRRYDNRPLINISLENNNEMNFNNEQVVNNLENVSQNDSNRNNENIQAMQIPRSENEAHPRSNQDSPIELNT